MGWKLWVVLVILGWGILLNIKGVWSPTPTHRDEDMDRRLSLVTLFIQVFYVYAILEAVNK
jgi:hypothetical protein